MLLALCAALILAAGLGRAFVVCQTDSGSHVDLVHAAGSCASESSSHHHCCGGHATAETPSSCVESPETPQGPPCEPTSNLPDDEGCVDRPLADDPQLPADGNNTQDHLSIGCASAPAHVWPPLTMPSARQAPTPRPPRPRPATERRRTDVLLV
jgi:hypothetical protein